MVQDKLFLSKIMARILYREQIGHMTQKAPTDLYNLAISQISHKERTKSTFLKMDDFLRRHMNPFCS